MTYTRTITVTVEGGSPETLLARLNAQIAETLAQYPDERGDVTTLSESKAIIVFRRIE